LEVAALEAEDWALHLILVEGFLVGEVALLELGLSLVDYFQDLFLDYL